MTIKGILFAAVIIAAALFLVPHLKSGGPNDAENNTRKPPDAVHVPSDRELTEIRQKFNDGVRRLCDNLTDTRYECHTNNN